MIFKTSAAYRKEIPLLAYVDPAANLINKF